MTTAPTGIQPDHIAWLNEHLDYEIKMLNGTFGMFFTLKGTADKAELTDNQRHILYDANKECFCMHVRQLEEFLRKTTAAGAHEISAKRYAPPAEPEFPDRKKFKEKLNRQIAHLIYGRPDDESEKLKDKDFEIMFKWVAGELDKLKKAIADPALNVRDVDLRLVPSDPAGPVKA